MLGWRSSSGRGRSLVSSFLSPQCPSPCNYCFFWALLSEPQWMPTHQPKRNIPVANRIAYSHG